MIFKVLLGFPTIYTDWDNLLSLFADTIERSKRMVLEHFWTAEQRRRSTFRNGIGLTIIGICSSRDHISPDDADDGRSGSCTPTAKRAHDLGTLMLS
jgi:hypothetical protein